MEQAFGHPIDLEWAFDAEQLWLIQARPIATVRPSSNLTNDDCEWSRTNFKETLPELPSLLSLSFLERFMDRHILSHYRRLGCRIPDRLTSVRVLSGRPYLNVTLFHILVAQLGGDPSLNAEQMGGELLQTIPKVQPINRAALARAVWMMWAEMRWVERSGPRLFQEMKDLATTYRRERILHLSVEELMLELDKFGPSLEGRELYVRHSWRRRSMPTDFQTIPASVARTRVEGFTERRSPRTRDRHQRTTDCPPCRADGHCPRRTGGRHISHIGTMGTCAVS